MKRVKHHFMPQFYLKYFTNDNGYYHVFDKKHNKFKNDPQSPKTSFYEYNRNTIKINNINTDFIEKTYSRFESDFARFINYITSNHYEIEIVESRSMIHVLKCYISFQFWRLPQHDIYIDRVIRNIDYNLCRNMLTDKNGKNVLCEDYMIELINDDKHFRHYFRCFILPCLLFNLFSNDDDVEKWRIYNTEKDTRFSFICSDVPIIYNNLADFFMFKGNILFPLTKNRILMIAKKEYPDYFPDSFWAYINMVLYEQSNRYFTVLDKQYLFELMDIYKDMEKINMTSLFRDSLFQFV